jgi:hypothetical protein
MNVPMDPFVPGPFDPGAFDSPIVLPAAVMPPGAVVLNRSSWASADVAAIRPMPMHNPNTVLDTAVLISTPSQQAATLSRCDRVLLK